LRGVALEVRGGEIVTLLGNNGAGKSTTLKTISGLLAPRRGSVVFDGRALTGVPPHEIVARGIAHVPEGRRIFNRLSVRENMTMGAYLRTDGHVAADLDRAFELFPRLKERLTQVAGTLSGGAPIWENDAMRTDGLDYDGHKVGAVYRTLARTVSETDIVNFVNLCGFVEPLFIDMEYVKRESVFARRAAPGALTFALSEGLI